MSAKDARHFALRAAYPERVVEGQLCDSVKEAQRYRDLLLLQQGGKISGLVYHKPYVLAVNGYQITVYIADFVYNEHGNIVVEDSKGFRTKEYKLKWKLMKAIYGIEIMES
jgi:hypothetical protein